MSVCELIDSIISSTKSEENPIKKQTTLILAIIQLSEKISTEVSIDSLKKYTKVLDYLDNSNKASIISSIMYTATKIASDVESNIELLKKLMKDSKFLLEFDNSFLESYNKRLESLQALKCEFDKLPDEKQSKLSEFEIFKAFNTSESKEEHKLQRFEIENIFDSDNLRKLPISSDSQLTKVKDIVTDINREVYIYLAKAEINGEIIQVLVKKNRLKTSTDEAEKIKREKEKLRLKSQCYFMLTLQGSEHVPKTYGIYHTPAESEFTLVMEYCGPDLSWHILNTWMENRSDSLKILKNAIESLIPGMISINARNIAHRDIKPENIFYCEQSGKFKIGDFDASMKISRTFGGSTMLYESNETVGTYPFISPEIRIYKDKMSEIEAAAKYRLSNLNKKLNKAKKAAVKEKVQRSMADHDQHIKNIKEGFKNKLNVNKSDVFSLGLTLLCILRPHAHNFWNSQMKIRSKYNYLDMIGKKIHEFNTINEDDRKILNKLIELNSDSSKSNSESDLIAELQVNINKELDLAFENNDQLSLKLRSILGCMLKINPEEREDFRTLNFRLREQLGSIDTFYD